MLKFQALQGNIGHFFLRRRNSRPPARAQYKGGRSLPTSGPMGDGVGMDSLTVLLYNGGVRVTKTFPPQTRPNGDLGHFWSQKSAAVTPTP